MIKTGFLREAALPGKPDAEGSPPAQSVDVAQEIPHRAGVKADQYGQIPEFIFDANLSAKANIDIGILIEVVICHACTRTDIPVESSGDIPVPVINTYKCHPGEVILETEAGIKLKPVSLVKSLLI